MWCTQVHKVHTLKLNIPISFTFPMERLSLLNSTYTIVLSISCGICHHRFYSSHYHSFTLASIANTHSLPFCFSTLDVFYSKAVVCNRCLLVVSYHTQNVHVIHKIHFTHPNTSNFRILLPIVCIYSFESNMINFAITVN